MRTDPAKIFEEYNEGVRLKASMGSRGMYEQIKINERFYAGDQWHGAKCPNERPLVRHNVIKRIGDYKMAQVLNRPVTVSFSADGIPDTVGLALDNKGGLRKLSEQSGFKGSADSREINVIMNALGNYRAVTAERTGFAGVCEQALRNAYISGSGIIYTYWDPDIKTGLYADEDRAVPIKGDIACEVLDIEDVYFGDPYCDSVQKQPYIIIASMCDIKDVRREVLRYSPNESALRAIKPSKSGKILVLTRLYKEYKENGEYEIMCTKVTENAVIREPFNTRLRMYPLSLFVWEKRGRLIYGESEVTYLIPNQIAINRMITAKVWSAMTMGMPMMVVNGDTVPDEVTNEPGQIIRIYGSNEDVANAVKFVAPPDFTSNFDESINDLIENTLTQNGANEAARGDSNPDNASAIIALQNMSSMPLELVKSRFYSMIEDVSRIWADFWITQYGDRRIKLEDESGVWYMPFDAERYRELLINARVDVGADTVFSTAEQIKLLTELFDKGIVTKQQYLKRLPRGIIPDIRGLLYDEQQEESQ